MPIEEKKKDAVAWNRIVRLVLLLLVIALFVSFVVVGTMHPELLKGMSQERRTAQLVVERLRDEFGMKPQSLDNEGT